MTSTGVWLNRKSPYGGGRLTVRMACPVQPKYDTVKKTWAVLCIRNDIFTHQKALLVNGFVRGAVQKYVMTGSANWSSPGPARVGRDHHRDPECRTSLRPVQGQSST